MPSLGPRTTNEPRYTSSPYEPVLAPVTELGQIDLTSADLYLKGDPHAAFRLLRAEAPVFWHDAGVAHGYRDEPFWAVSTYQGFERVLKDAETFSNVEGTTLDLISRPGGLFTAEGEVHRRYRSVVAQYTSRSVVEAARERIEAIIEVMLADFVSADSPDVGELANALPPELLNAFFDLSDDEAERFRKIHYWDDWSAEGLVERQSLQLETFDVLAQERIAHPRDDVFTWVVRDEKAGLLTPEQGIGYLLAMTEAGLVGTRSAIQNAVIALLHHPEQYELLRGNPGLIDDGRAVEELLRWAGHSVHVSRRATRDTEILGQPIAAGDVVVAFHGSANRDEQVFADPYRLDLGRPRQSMLAFSTGPHQCLGQFFIRTAMTTLLKELTSRVESMQQQGPMERVLAGSVIASFVTRLPISLSPGETSHAPHS